MRTYKWVIIFVNLLLLLLYFNFSVIEKERLLKGGRLVLLELAPKDPRSLMQGDYMTLRYKISEDLDFDNSPKRGYCVVRLDQNNRAEKVRLQRGLTPLSEGEYLIRYKSSNRWNIYIGAEAFFFQEGHARRYESAKYGGVKIDKEGRSVLIGLYDGQLRKIE